MRTLLFSVVQGIFISFSTAQKPDSLHTGVMNLNEYLGFVKAHHPVVSQARLTLNMAQARLMEARGGFDPGIEIDHSRKKFQGSEYYDLLNSTFKIPVWFGIDLKAGVEQNEGIYLDPQRTVPENGLYSVGISVPLGQGLFINDRMAALKKAKIFQELAKAQRDMLVNQVLYDAAIAYFNWFNAYNEVRIYENFRNNAEIRFKGIRRQALAGAVAGIDTVEARITVRDRALSLEQARVKLLKARLEASGFLWLNDVPLELQPHIIPDTLLLQRIDKTLKINNELPEDFRLEDHPKIRALQFKIQSLEIDRKLKAEKLKPKLDMEFNVLTASGGTFNSINTSDYKLGFVFKFPLLLRKERGDLELARLKVRDARLDYDMEALRLSNAIAGNYQELISFDMQISLLEDIIKDYQQLVSAEERKFGFGESSVFLINSRELSLINARLKQNELHTSFMERKAALFRTLVTEY